MEAFLISVVVLVAIFTFVLTLAHNSDKKRLASEEEQRKLDQQKLIKDQRAKDHFINVTAPLIAEKLAGEFSSLTAEEQQIVFSISDKFSSEDLNSAELIVLQAACSNPATYNLLQLRNTKIAATEQNKILQTLSSKASTVRAASVVGGFAAAKHLGESIGEDLGGGE